MASPQLGSYIRPVGKHLMYCYQVVKVLPECRDHAEQWWCMRFGMDPAERQPIKDGHQNVSYLNGLKQVAPGVWKDEWEFETPRWSCCPIYYRALQVGPQGDLFQ
jgi:hypothetical protein